MLCQRHFASIKNRNQQIAIAAVIFDEEGKVMVTPEGYLPHRRITSTYLEKVSAQFPSVYEHMLIYYSQSMMSSVFRTHYSSGCFVQVFTGTV
jgi:hypothetical protein